MMAPSLRRGDDWDRTSEFDRTGTGLRWSACFLVMAGLFAGAALIAVRWTPAAELPPKPPAAAIMIDLEPLPAASPAPPLVRPPGPQRTLSQPEPAVQPPASVPTPPAQAPQATQPSAPEVAIPLPPPPPPRPHAEHRPSVVALRTPAPQSDRTLPAPATTAPPQQEAPSSAAPASATSTPPVPTPPSNAVPTWQGRLLGRLEQFKHYPQDAQYRREQGVAYLRFSMDRTGRVLSANIGKSSGHSELDQETLALIFRAEPLPPPPPEVPGNPIELVVPVQFLLK
jgi:periplasmic protein TonB